MCDYLLYCSKFTCKENCYFGIFDVLLCFSTASVSQPVWSWLSLLYKIFQAETSKRKTHQNTILLGHALYYTVLYTDRDRNEINEGMQGKKEKKDKKWKADKHVSVSWLWACGYWW